MRVRVLAAVVAVAAAGTLLASAPAAGAGIGAGAGDDDDARRPERFDGLAQMRDHRPPADRVQHLMERGFHPAADAGREDDDGQRR